jgi:signal peptidase II
MRSQFPVANRFLLVVFILIDQITKAVFSSRDFSIGPIRVALVKNFGLPFAIGTSGPASFIITFVILLALAWYYIRARHSLSWLENLGFQFIFAGALSNILDRILLGYVRDMIDLRLGFVFNFADAFIVVGILLILGAGFRKSETLN